MENCNITFQFWSLSLDFILLITAITLVPSITFRGPKRLNGESTNYGIYNETIHWYILLLAANRIARLVQLREGIFMT